MFRGSHGSEKFGFSGAGRCDGLRFAPVRDGTAAQEESIAGSGAAISQIVGVGGIKECCRLVRIDIRERRQVSVKRGTDEVGRW